MYIPKQFEFEDEAEKIAFMKQYSFATMVTTKAGVPIATQLPFLVTQNSGKLVLSAHFALANEQVGYIEDNISLVIFSEPHAYISPVHYDKRESVPTWDYVTLHAYGKAKIVHDELEKMKALENMIVFYEPGYLEQWSQLTEKFKKGMMRGIVAFELEVTDLQAQKKVSQNKTETERQRIADYLDKSDSSTEKAIADFIRKI
ncbi:FMN-binding negative transcriptional regulator [Pedobacter cryoconitis]|uniref:PaiB family negative transcriptional regulator n=1 Tax=Pedobacter cryoconitis TaxID=188932 RepID=A0A327SBC6_9SPHI|nr:FMN-binding negative transcriptional regulator [Pedobacter cryoconitis]RAJ26320.1 PaiB family negative transcriptional regulator [Pedobacter cryoconitis]